MALSGLERVKAVKRGSAEYITGIIGCVFLMTKEMKYVSDADIQELKKNIRMLHWLINVDLKVAIETLGKE